MASIEGFEKFEAHIWGVIAEWIAFIFLMVNAYSVLDRRWRSPVGEIDIVAQKNNLLVFVEVKARPTLEKALESVSPQQRVRIENAARSWIASNPRYADHNVRFDVMAVAPYKMPRHLKDAWRPNKG